MSNHPSPKRRLHEKNKVAVTGKLLWRLSISLNDEPERLQSVCGFPDDAAERFVAWQQSNSAKGAQS